MVLGYHLIFSTYGFWLPNDPRGSGSTYVGSRELYQFGPATKVDANRSVAANPHDRELRLAAKAALKYPPVQFDESQRYGVGAGFGEYSSKSNVLVWACAIMADHVHLVIARHRLLAESIVTQLKGAATRALMATQCHPLARFTADGERPPTCWGGGQRIVYLDTVDDIVRCIRYVEANPLKAGLPRQSWPFVTAFDPGRVS